MLLKSGVSFCVPQSAITISQAISLTIHLLKCICLTVVTLNVCIY